MQDLPLAAPYDEVVMVCVVGLYLAAFAFFRVPQGIWRFSGFGEVKRLAWAVLLADGVSAAGVLMMRLEAVPRAVLALHPIVTLMGVCLVRLGSSTPLLRSLAATFLGTAVAAASAFFGLHDPDDAAPREPRR